MDIVDRDEPNSAESFNMLQWLRNQLNRRKADCKRMQRENNRLKMENDRLKSQVSRQDTTLVRLEAEISSLQTLQHLQNRDWKQLQAKVALLIDETKILLTENESLKSATTK